MSVVCREGGDFEDVNIGGRGKKVLGDELSGMGPMLWGSGELGMLCVFPWSSTTVR